MPAPVGCGAVGWKPSLDSPAPSRSPWTRALRAAAARPGSSTRNAAPSPRFIPIGWENGAHADALTTPSAQNPAYRRHDSRSDPPTTTASNLPVRRRSAPAAIAMLPDAHADDTVRRGPDAPMASAIAIAARL